MEITIHQLQETDAEELFHFEVKNRNFFEKMVPSRSKDYYQFESFKVILQDLLTEQAKKQSTFYIIREKSGTIVGRINLVDINTANTEAEVGFRVGKEFGGKGIGNLALKLLLNEERAINKLKAKTTINNIASQRVLEKNGFKQILIHDDDFFEMNGQKFEFIHYILER